MADKDRSEGERGVPESTVVYRALRRVYRPRRAAAAIQGSSEAYAPGRDPDRISAALGGLAAQLGWNDELARAMVANEWADLVGPNVAEHSWPVFDGSRLTIRCDSTAWASSLRMMRSSIEGAVRERYPGLELSDIHFRGPDAPSWKRGPRSVPGRGPRDTYG